uniref:Uncharacterized protein n=1 Tax=Branchiostoma floridae TaxID=7739 RepID=C3YHD1_BRAFL|eukprot:XP_002604356.1 hypothetical protein BRAFLDRAFT_85447 [Branchiostoma floridae]
MADSDIPRSRADIDQSLVQYGTEEYRQIVQQPTNDLPLLPYITPPPVIYKVYNISNPVGLQIESQGGLMAVEDLRKALEDQKRECKETQTDWSRDNEDKERRQREYGRERTCQGNWAKYDKFLRTAMKRHEEDHDILVRIVLEDVVAAYFREDFHGGYTSLHQADDLVQKVSDPAQQQAHRLYLKSALLRKQRRHEEAENINTLALQGLPHIRPGRDMAAIWYNIAALKAQVLYECENSPDRAKELYLEAISAFHNAIEHYGSGLDAKDETCRNQLRRSHIRLAMVAVGCCGKQPKEVENNLWEGIPKRMRCSWYLAKSDLFRRRGKTQRATEMAEEALKVAKTASGDLPSELRFAEVRLGLLKRTDELKREETRVEKDAEDMAWLSPDGSLVETDAMVAVGCWYDGTSTVTNPGLIPKQDLQIAENSLQEVENNLWEGIPKRMRCSWYLAKSDLFRRRGKTQRATEMAEEALKVAKTASGDLPSELRFAEVRLGLLKRTDELKREETRVEKDAEDMAWLSPDGSLVEVKDSSMIGRRHGHSRLFY